jgi:hypothetical protein
MENETHASGQRMGVPAGHLVSGSVSQFLPQVIVRQKACALETSAVVATTVKSSVRKRFTDAALDA